LLGKGWQGMAELIGQGSAELKASLAGVADAQVIDEDELAKAREFRDRMDEVRDRLDAVALAVGEAVVPVLGNLADAAGVAADAFGVLNTTLVEDGEASVSLTSGYGDFIDLFKTKWNKVFGDEAPAAMEATITSMKYGTEAADEMAAMYAERLVPSADAVATSIGQVDRSAQDFTDEARRAEEATRDLDDAYKTFLGSLDQQDAWDGFFEKMYVYHSETGRSAQETRDYTRDIAEMVMALENVPPETKAQMIATLDAGNIAAIESRLNQLARNRVVSIGGQLVGGGLRNEMEGRMQERAAGGPVTAGTPYIVGERGPEIVVPGRSGTVIPNNRIGVGGGVNVTINMPPGSNGHDVVAAIQQYEKRNGKSWRS
jgi:hypothetical protein